MAELFKKIIQNAPFTSVHHSSRWEPLFEYTRESLTSSTERGAWEGGFDTCAQPWKSAESLALLQLWDHTRIQLCPNAASKMRAS